MDKHISYKASRFFGREATQRPQPIWFVAPARQLFQGTPVYDWQTGLPQKQVYYMDAAHTTPIAQLVYTYEAATQKTTHTWHWAIGYGEDWEADDPVSTVHPPAVFESLLQQGRQRILDYVMLQGRQAFGDKADTNINLLYSRYQQPLLTWKQSGIPTPLHQALDADLLGGQGEVDSKSLYRTLKDVDATQAPTGINLDVMAAEEQMPGTVVGEYPPDDPGWIDPRQPLNPGDPGYPLVPLDTDSQIDAGDEADKKREGADAAAEAEKKRAATAEKAAAEKAAALPAQGEQAAPEGDQKEAEDVRALLAQPLGCTDLPEVLKGKKLIDYLKYYIK